mmetsp:Transcript_15218/g.15976  ORF Transcript_15218/g.15976 Transcript_15218/m.15976 type:complete len:143 (+) Transcript_15218:1-429(+)
MKENNSKLILNNNEIAKVIIESDINEVPNMTLKGTITTSTSNDYILIFSKENESFELHDVKLSINGLKRDRENEFIDVRNSAETSSEIKAKMNKRLKLATSSSSSSSSTSSSSKSQIKNNQKSSDSAIVSESLLTQEKSLDS